jgi:hypothetical protein
MVLGVLLLRDSGFDHFGDTAGGKREGEDYRQVFHGSVFSPGRGESQMTPARLTPGAGKKGIPV